MATIKMTGGGAGQGSGVIVSEPTTVHGEPVFADGTIRENGFAVMSGGTSSDGDVLLI